MSKSTYQDALEWIDNEFKPEDYNTFDDYMDAIRDEFQNDNLIDVLEEDLAERFENQ